MSDTNPLKKEAECDCDNLDEDVEGYTCYKCYERGA